MGHVVWTLDEVKALIPKHKEFWLSNCGCREGKDCSKGLQVCLGFSPGTTSTKSGLEKIGHGRVKELLRFAHEKKLVSRPYLSDEGKVVAVCFCCDCHCYYHHGGEKEDKAGPSMESTDAAKCTACGACVEACYFKARKVDGGSLEVTAERCFGCGLCVEACLEGAIAMVLRVSGLNLS